MKSLCSIILGGLLVCGVYGFITQAIADSPGAAPDRVTLLSVTAPTGGIAAVSSSSGRLSGYVDGFYLTVAGTAYATGTVTIATSASYGDMAAARTIYTLSTVQSGINGYFPIRIQAKDTTGSAIAGEYLPITLFNDVVTLSATNWSTTGATVRVALCLRRD